MSALQEMYAALERSAVLPGGRGQYSLGGYVTHLPELRKIISELTDQVPLSICRTGSPGIGVEITIFFTLDYEDVGATAPEVSS